MKMAGVVTAIGKIKVKKKSQYLLLTLIMVPSRTIMIMARAIQNQGISIKNSDMRFVSC